MSSGVKLYFFDRGFGLKNNFLQIYLAADPEQIFGLKRGEKWRERSEQTFLGGFDVKIG